MSRPPAKPKPAVENVPTAPATTKVPEGFVEVETTGEFMLLDITTGAEINPGQVVAVPDSSFIRDRIEMGQLRLAD